MNQNALNFVKEPKQPAQFGETLPLSIARIRLQQLAEDGVRCPCCRQWAQVYRRKINSGMAVSLIAMYRKAGLDWIHIPTSIGGRSREEGKLRYWDLIEEENQLRDDGGRAGWWRVREKGRAFLRGEIQLPKYALIYDGVLMRLIEQPMIGIRDSLGSRFNYEELMQGL